jgi:metal-responsive CopG/Arc/MetJ family transcriptional regulator
MVRTSTPTRRVKVSVTVDPELVYQVDAFVGSHPALDRSKIFDEALDLWYAQKQQETIEEQYAQAPTVEEAKEIAAWRRIQAEAADRIFRSDRK